MAVIALGSEGLSRTGAVALPARLLPLVLASASPRRAELLARAGLAVRIAPVNLDEQALPGEGPAACCLRLAREKARAGALAAADCTVLGGDTLVELDGRALGKPANAAEARAMLSALAGRRHRVLSAVALARRGAAQAAPQMVSALASAEVSFAPLASHWLDGYLAGGEWRDKAGAYAIQGQAAAFARLVSGELDTVVGLPIALLPDLFQRLGELLP
ncbi:MAG: Maf family protein [Planctomycetota bacterium]